MRTVAPSVVEGHVSRGFEAVRDAFEQNFARRGELGGACCAYYRGEKVVDLWGGVRNKVTGEPWEPDTMVVVHSATKGLGKSMLASHLLKIRHLSRYFPQWQALARGRGEKIAVPGRRGSAGLMPL
jgi:CubicO group peptidase (beta-lactamase class C family)